MSCHRRECALAGHPETAHLTARQVRLWGEPGQDQGWLSVPEFAYCSGIGVMEIAYYKFISLASRVAIIANARKTR